MPKQTLEFTEREVIDLLAAKATSSGLLKPANFVASLTVVPNGWNGKGFKIVLNVDPLPAHQLGE